MSDHPVMLTTLVWLGQDAAMKAKKAEIELEQKLLRETAELTKVCICEWAGNLITYTCCTIRV